jgi:hypothetical protein
VVVKDLGILVDLLTVR